MNQPQNEGETHYLLKLDAHLNPEIGVMTYSQIGVNELKSRKYAVLCHDYYKHYLA